MPIEDTTPGNSLINFLPEVKFAVLFLNISADPCHPPLIARDAEDSVPPPKLFLLWEKRYEPPAPGFAWS